MPIYAYRCTDCGFAKEALQKVSDAPLTVCPSCNNATFKKQLTAAGFQLKGTGWYATDFRNGSGTSAPAVSSDKGKEGANDSSKSSDTSSGNAASSTSTAAAPSAAATPAPSA